jgi:L,D-peptidoglycan transpeptidase YkuD (ErfK/YbiS/YcfS/YnhG family)
MLCMCLLALQGCCTGNPNILQGLDPSINQVILVHPTNGISHQANLSAWQRDGHVWHRQYYVSAVIGRKGLALPGEKREGDGKTPFGIFPLGPAFGYAPAMSTGLEYRQAGNLDFWVDDVQSMQYNQWVMGKPAANSFERMRRLDNLYQYGIVIGYNMHPIVKGAGSAIFMHVWRRYNGPTSGCVALNQRYLRRILRWLNKEDQPVIIME